MSVQSKFFQVTNQVLLEYKTDQYKITVTHKESGADESDFYMYRADDGGQYCMEKTNVSAGKYPIDCTTQYYYGGNEVTDFELVPAATEPIYGSDIEVNGRNIGVIVKDVSDNETRSSQINHDTIRLYLLTGYVMNGIAGYALRVRGLVTRVQYTDINSNIVYKRLNDSVTLLDWFMPKEELKDRIQWLSNPLYLNSKFYDRYIEIKFPAPLDVALNDRDIDYVHEHVETDAYGQPYTVYMRGKVDPNSNWLIDFATVQNEYMDMKDESGGTYECEFSTDGARTFAISRYSNANNFNARLVEDPSNHCIVYYPAFGDLMNESDMTIDMMQAIDSGVISMIDQADMDYANEGMDDFIEMYGEDTYRWVIINELTVSYNYDYIISRDNGDTTRTVTEYYTNTIDYTGKTSDHGQFWRSRFIPTIQQFDNMTCRSIIVSYTAHLFNRMNNIDIIRTASMTVTDPYRYTLSSIQTDNITLYKVINRINKIEMGSPAARNASSGTQTIRSYYNVTNLLMRDVDAGVSYSQGQMTLRLYHSGNNYLLRLYELQDDDTQTPYDLTGNVQYKLVFPDANGGKIEIFPNKDSENYNLGIGSLIFHIPADKSSAIMQVMASERYFALTTYVQGNSGEESVLYEGKVEWIS